LISIPTGTSTILGVFQAILALLANRTNSALAPKLIGIENFASEIFVPERVVFVAALQKIHFRVRTGTKAEVASIASAGLAGRLRHLASLSRPKSR
jgi:hypothetical protein